MAHSTFSAKIADFTGSVTVLVGTVAAFYIGLWLLFVGGVINVINAFDPFSLGLLALGILKVFVADMVGLGIFSVSVIVASLIRGDTK